MSALDYWACGLANFPSIQQQYQISKDAVASPGFCPVYQWIAVKGTSKDKTREREIRKMVNKTHF